MHLKNQLAFSMNQHVSVLVSVYKKIWFPKRSAVNLWGMNEELRQKLDSCWSAGGSV